MTGPEDGHVRKLGDSEGEAQVAVLDLETELRMAADDFANGRYIEVTPGWLHHCAETGEWLWPDESPD
ncbi:MAG TPA: hypothetical protein VMS65_12630 [Polyangiaceae bacterium]|nr:hypothetical protein [Polyangiaceae bacterium]